jgi:plasmid maintenance system antidote protein VapI
MNNQEAKIYLGKAIAFKLMRECKNNKELSHSLKVSTTTVANVLNGYYERLSIRMYMKMADKLNLTIEVSITENEND